jgi:hypothetical protein
MAELITRTEFGKRIGVSGAMVSKYVRAGLPTRPDKRVEWPAGKEWHQKFVAPMKSGNHRFRQNQKIAAEQKPELVQIMAEPEPAVVQTAADLLKRLHGPGMVRAVAMAKGLGLSPAAQQATVYGLCSWLWDLSGDAAIFECGADGPAVDYSALARLNLTPAEEIESERLAEQVEAVLKRLQRRSKGAAPDVVKAKRTDRRTQNA